MEKFTKRSVTAIACVLVILLWSGCATPRTQMGEGKGLEVGSKIEVASVTVEEDQNFEVDVVQMMREELDTALGKKNLSWSGDPSEKHYSLSINITDYEMGSAFKRWLIPGYGATNLQIHCQLTDPSTGELLEDFTHKRSVAAGGFYTVGAWKSIFRTVADDLATDIERRTSGEPIGFFIEIDPWLENEAEAPAGGKGIQVALLPIKDSRPDKTRLGERTAAFNVSMGNVYFNRDVPDYMQEALRNELLASGNALTDEDPDVALQGEIVRFWVYTNTTALYWDVIAEVTLTLNRLDPDTKDVLATKSYSSESVTRTYIWPTKDLAAGVLTESIQKLMYDVRSDAIWLDDSTGE